MSVTLRKRENADGTTSLYLDIYHAGTKRRKEFLKELKLAKASTPADREANKSRLLLAKKIAVQRAAEIEGSGYNVLPEHKTKVDFLEYWEAYIKRYTKKDLRNMQGACRAFRQYMEDEKIKSISMKGLTEAHVKRFAEYLEEHHEGEGAASYFARFKKMLKHAMREKVLLNNPAADISVKRDDSIRKQVLTVQEIQLLAETPTANDTLKRAFLFSCFTGLRWVDVIALRWKHIDRRNQALSIVQRKTGRAVTVQLHASALDLLPVAAEPEEAIFTLPSHTGALKTLNAWVQRAGITKHITWHCARHSFATNLITHKADVTTISKLMGHSTLKYTQRYTHIADELKRAAIDSLPAISMIKPTDTK